MTLTAEDGPTVQRLSVMIDAWAVGDEVAGLLVQVDHDGRAAASGRPAASVRAAGDSGRATGPVSAGPSRRILRAGRVTLDLVTRHVRVDGRSRSRGDLLGAVWGIDVPTSSSVVDVPLLRLWTKLRLDE